MVPQLFWGTPYVQCDNRLTEFCAVTKGKDKTIFVWSTTQAEFFSKHVDSIWGITKSRYDNVNHHREGNISYGWLPHLTELGLLSHCQENMLSECQICILSMLLLLLYNVVVHYRCARASIYIYVLHSRCCGDDLTPLFSSWQYHFSVVTTCKDKREVCHSSCVLCCVPRCTVICTLHSRMSRSYRRISMFCPSFIFLGVFTMTSLFMVGYFCFIACFLLIVLN